MKLTYATADNALSGIACPRCLSQESFLVDARANALVTDEGFAEYTNPLWTGDAEMTCRACGHQNAAEHFAVENGDLLLTDDQVAEILDDTIEPLSAWATNIERDAGELTITLTVDDPEYGEIVYVATYAEIRRGLNDALKTSSLPVEFTQGLEEDRLVISAEVGNIALQTALWSAKVY